MSSEKEAVEKVRNKLVDGSVEGVGVWLEAEEVDRVLRYLTIGVRVGDALEQAEKEFDQQIEVAKSLPEVPREYGAVLGQAMMSTMTKRDALRALDWNIVGR